MERLGVQTVDMPAELLESVACAVRSARSERSRENLSIAGLWFPQSAHVVDPQLICHAFAEAAVAQGTRIWRTSVEHVQARGEWIEIQTEEGSVPFGTVVICAGAWSAPLLESFGLKAPLEAARGYHVELPAHRPIVDAPLAYVDTKILVTPMTGRLRASTYMEFAGLDAPADPRKIARLRNGLKQLGYDAEGQDPGWMGARPVLPDYLPGIGRAPRHRLFYAIGHQHIGLTLAPVTGALIADLVAERTPRHDVSAFDLQRFGHAAKSATRKAPP
jgi:D-amino-acid dehydrogenase